MKHTILFLAANPDCTNQIALAEECAAIQRELRMTSGRDDFDFRSGWAVTVDDMMRHFSDHSPTILHFSGHGSGTNPPSHAGPVRDAESARRAGIFLHDGNKAHCVNEAALAGMVKAAAPSTRLVVLNACYTAAFGESLRQVVDCVIGMDGAIEDGAAHAFAVALYRALGNRCSVGNAMEQVEATLRAKQLPYHLPVCRTREGLVAGSLLLGAPEPRRSGNAMSRTGEDVSHRTTAASPLSQTTATELIDVFLAHPSINKATADALYDLLRPDLRVFLAARSLPTSEHWDRDVLEAQRASRVTILLLSSRCDAAWYLSNEVLTAIALHRASDEHRLILLLLDGGVSIPQSLKHAPVFDVTALGGLDAAAARLRGELAELLAQDARAFRALSPAAGPTVRSHGRHDHHALYDRLAGLSGTVFEQVVTSARIDLGLLAPPGASHTERALDVAQLAALDSGLFRRVLLELERRAPWTRR